MISLFLLKAMHILLYVVLNYLGKLTDKDLKNIVKKKVNWVHPDYGLSILKHPRIFRNGLGNASGLAYSNEKI